MLGAIFGTSCISPLIAGSFETDFVLPLYNFSPHPVVIQLLCGNFAMLAFLYKSESQSSEFSFLSSLSCDQTVRLDYSLLLGHSVAIVLLYSGELIMHIITIKNALLLVKGLPIELKLQSHLQRSIIIFIFKVLKQNVLRLHLMQVAQNNNEQENQNINLLHRFLLTNMIDHSQMSPFHNNRHKINSIIYIYN